MTMATLWMDRKPCEFLMKCGASSFKIIQTSKGRRKLPKKKDKSTSLKKVPKNNNQEEKHPKNQKKAKNTLKIKGGNKDNKAVLAEILTLLQKLV
ncbi:hypothetical protein GLOIN_2v1641446 [Rhizophagus irregularis DAOM 181602=DAOM 197198]|nr:hypothetical protein GLOIN_2v1641446 [Rhizophagus irregularis DAOM 181602=DAOM 197198]